MYSFVHFSLTKLLTERGRDYIIQRINNHDFVLMMDVISIKRHGIYAAGIVICKGVQLRERDIMRIYMGYGSMGLWRI